MKKYLVFWKTVAWTVVMLVLFLIPSHDIPRSIEIPHLDKMVHVALFSVFTIFYLRDRLKFRGLKYISPIDILRSFLIVLFFATMVELVQMLMNVGREGDFIDILFDISGFILGLVAMFLLYGIRIRPRAL